MRQCDLIIGITAHEQTIDSNLYKKLKGYSEGKRGKKLDAYAQEDLDDLPPQTPPTQGRWWR